VSPGHYVCICKRCVQLTASVTPPIIARTGECVMTTRILDCDASAESVSMDPNVNSRVSIPSHSAKVTLMIELSALGADRCSHPELYYKTTSTSSSTSSGDCTSRAIYFAEVTAKSTSYGRSCVSYMGQGYRAGIDGGAVTHPESMEYYRCEKGEIRLKYAYDICCPSKCL
jgi:hypothetical protein